MSQKKESPPTEPKLTLAEARLRSAEFKSWKRIEGAGAGAAVRPGRDEKPPHPKAKR
jgi:hypothetical protein